MLKPAKTENANSTYPDSDQNHRVHHDKPNVRHKGREDVEQMKQGRERTEQEHARVVEDQRVVQRY